jgi:transient receptor potential cation channel subfamily M member 3
LNYNITLPDIGLVVEKLIGGGYVSEYSKRSFKLKYIKFLEKISNLSGSDAPSTDSYVFKYPCNELLIWAVLMKRHKMAMFVCKRGEETLAKALVASKLNKALAREAELDDLDNEVSDEFKGYSE